VYQLDWADYFKVTVEVILTERKMSGKAASSLAAGLVQAGAEAVTELIE
jgi:ABC-type sulfate transport system substrate-binding protein